MPPKEPTAPVILTLTLPPTSGIRKLGTLVAHQGDLAVMVEFEYTDLTGISSAISSASSKLALKKALHDEQAAQAKLAQKASKSAAAPSHAPNGAESANTPDDASEEPEDSNDADSETTDDNDHHVAETTLTLLSEAGNLSDTDILSATPVATQAGQTNLF
ncbi:MAG: hypothetical protein ABI700_00935 [Chloroflexota bacterium]